MYIDMDNINDFREQDFIKMYKWHYMATGSGLTGVESDVLRFLLSQMDDRNVSAPSKRKREQFYLARGICKVQMSRAIARIRACGYVEQLGRGEYLVNPLVASRVKRDDLVKIIVEHADKVVDMVERHNATVSA